MRKRRDRSDSSEMAGDGSFLDIIANMVGILILLVLVVGVRAAMSPTVAQGDQEETLEAAVDSADVEATIAEMKTLMSDAVSSAARAKYLEQSARALQQDRDHLAQSVARAEAEYQSRKSQLSSTDQSAIQRREALMEATRELEELDLEFAGVAAIPERVSDLEHVSTPVRARTEKDPITLEVHRGRIRVVPVAELVGLCEKKRVSTVQVGAQRFDSDEGLHAFGPISGYTMHRLKYRRILTNDRGQRASIVQMQAEFRPTDPNAGESVPQALAAGSLLRNALDNRPAETHFVKIWARGDSGDVARALEKYLRERRYQIDRVSAPQDRAVVLALVPENQVRNYAQ